MSTAIAVQDNSPMTPMRLIEVANERGASIEQMAQLFELKLRVEADEARKAFNSSMARFKADPPQINKNKHVKFGNTEYDHATLDHVVEVITPALSDVGIRHHWELKQEPGWVTVTCILSHELGHTERAAMTAQCDTSGSKNAIQAAASTVTYLQRYTLLSVTGLAATGTDTDGATPKGPQMKEGVLADFVGSIEAADSEDELKAAFNPAYKAAEQIGDKGAMGDLIKARNKRRAAFAGSR